MSRKVGSTDLDHSAGAGSASSAGVSESITVRSVESARRKTSEFFTGATLAAAKDI
jgi:hypothetical protein